MVVSCGPGQLGRPTVPQPGQSGMPCRGDASMCCGMLARLMTTRGGGSKCTHPDLHVVVGLPGFEPGTSASRTQRANQAAPQPVVMNRVMTPTLTWAMLPDRDPTYPRGFLCWGFCRDCCRDAQTPWPLRTGRLGRARSRSSPTIPLRRSAARSLVQSWPSRCEGRASASPLVDTRFGRRQASYD
jgi:hypothetical protein